MSGYRDPVGFFRMLVLAMTPFCCNKIPSVSLNELDDLADSSRVNPPGVLIIF
jgi:hypothetical protein